MKVSYSLGRQSYTVIQLLGASDCLPLSRARTNLGCRNRLTASSTAPVTHTKLHRYILTPNSSVFGHCVYFGLMRLNAFRWGCYSRLRRGPKTEHVRGLLQRRDILDSLCWRVLHCSANEPVHIWLPRSVARKNNHGLTRDPREPSDWQAVEGKTLKLATRGDNRAGRKP